MVPREADRGGAVREVGDLHLAHRTESPPSQRPFTGSTSHSPVSSVVDAIASLSVRSDDTELNGTPCPAHRIPIRPPRSVIRPAKTGQRRQRLGQCPRQWGAVEVAPEEHDDMHGQFATIASPTSQRMSSRRTVDGLISWVGTAATSDDLP